MTASPTTASPTTASPTTRTTVRPRRRRAAVTAALATAVGVGALAPLAALAPAAHARAPIARSCFPNCPPVTGNAYGYVSKPASTWVVGATYNSTGAANTVSHPTTGQYTVTLPGLSASGVANITGEYGLCNLASATSSQAGGTVLDVRCWNGNTPADGEFSFHFTSRRTTSATSTSFAWAFVDDGVSSKTTPARQYLSPGGTITTAHPKAGTYTVKLPWLGYAPGKAAHVTAVGSNAWCSITSFGTNPNKVSEQWVKVKCLDAAAAPVDTAFMFDFLWTGDQGHGTQHYTNLASGAIVDLGSDHSGTVEIAPAWRDSSAAQNATYSRSFAGIYTVHLKGFAQVGNAQVSAVGSGKNRCSISSVSATSVGIRCAPIDNPAKFVDSPFLLQYTTTG